MLLINNIDQQHVRGQTLQWKSWWHWYHSALVQHSDQQHNILWTPCCSRHQPLRSERVTASSSGTHNHTASGAGAVMTPSTGLGLDGELSAPSSIGVGRHRWAKHTVRVNRQQNNAQQPHSLLQQQGTCGHPGRSLDYVGRVVLGRRRVRVDVACSAGGRKEQGRDYPRSAGECRGGSGTGGQRRGRMVAGNESKKTTLSDRIRR